MTVQQICCNIVALNLIEPSVRNDPQKRPFVSTIAIRDQIGIDISGFKIANIAIINI